jgi:hypothetical protein
MKSGPTVRVSGCPIVTLASAVVPYDLVVAYRESRDIGIRLSPSRECRSGRTELRLPRGTDIRLGNTAQALHFANALRLEHRSRRIVNYLRDSYSAAG